MVAEHAFIDPRHEDDNENMIDCINVDERADREGKGTKFIGDLMPVEFDPMEVERRIKSEIVKIFAESQNQVKLEMMTSIDALNAKLSSELAECAHSLNAKVDAVKSAQTARAVHDDYVSRTIDGNVANLSDEMAKVWKALAAESDNRQENISGIHNTLISSFAEINLSYAEIKNKTPETKRFNIQTPQDV